MKLCGLAITLALAVGMPAAQALAREDDHDNVPKLDHVFVIVLENHNSFTSFGSIGILDNRKRRRSKRSRTSTTSRRTTMASGTRACRIISR
jgi:hypothetical protein